jgi:hypothetical protein
MKKYTETEEVIKMPIITSWKDGLLYRKESVIITGCRVVGLGKHCVTVC